MARGQFSEGIESVEYKYSLVSGQQVLELSGETKLESIIVGRKTSGQIITIVDASISGQWLSAGAKVIGLIHAGDDLNVPVQLNYRVELCSGLTVIASGATWNLTVLTKK